MNEETDKPNTFAEMNADKPNTEAPSQEAHKAPDEISIENLSDTAVGDSKKYIRPDLEGREDVIEKFQVFLPSQSDEVQTSKAGTCKFWRVNMILTYDSENSDAVKNKEYISGARCFQQKDGQASDVNFWYDTMKKSQVIMLWEEVALFKNIKPDELSPREFVAFLNSKPKVKIVGRMFDNYNAKPGSPAQIKKNWPVFLRA